MEDFSDLEVGSKVFIRESNFYGEHYMVKKVDRITPKGLICIGNSKFLQDGREWGGARGSRLERWTKEKEEEITLSNMKKQTINSCRYELKNKMNNLSYEQSKKILEILNENE